MDAFGYTNVRSDGFEADDVIATLAGRAAREGIDVTVVTGDRDAFQLIEDVEDGGKVRIWPPAAASPTPSSTTARR